MLLSLQERERLTIYTASKLALEHRERGLRLNLPEVTAVLTSFLLEGARDGRTKADLQDAGRDVLRRSLPRDQGPETRDWQDVRVVTDIDIYFCDPHAPWQRGTNENTNGLLRQYSPKGTDLSVHSEADLDAIAAELNDRPRKQLNFAKPIELIGPLLLQ